MMDRQERSALTAALCNVVREYVAKSEEKSSQWVNGELKALTELFEERIRSIPAGARGEQGERGERGEVGPIGQTGERGDVGEKGDKGEPGEGVPGLPGKDGLDGKHGRDGIDGKDGAPGLDGKSIIGERGEMGLSGKDGRDGRDGISGKDGRDGESGRDALSIDILPGIDPAKSYLRGTYAHHKGGIVRFREDKWEVVVDGIDSVRFDESEDPREVKIVIVRTSGIESSLQRHIPMMIYRGTFTDESDYLKGDTVSRDGSTWHCNVNGTKQIPGNANSQDWTLCNKRGSPGKDADKQAPTNGNHPVRLK